MIFACSVVKSSTLDGWVADENGVRVAERKKIADFALGGCRFSRSPITIIFQNFTLCATRPDAGDGDEGG
jgi:hypothetical protein